MTISYRSWNQPDISDWKKALMPRQKIYMLLIADKVLCFGSLKNPNIIAILKSLYIIS